MSQDLELSQEPNLYTRTVDKNNQVNVKLPPSCCIRTQYGDIYPYQLALNIYQPACTCHTCNDLQLSASYCWFNIISTECFDLYNSPIPRKHHIAQGHITFAIFSGFPN